MERVFCTISRDVVCLGVFSVSFIDGVGLKIST